MKEDKDDKIIINKCKRWKEEKVTQGEVERGIGEKGGGARMW